jgi:hypothetical protein
MELKENLLTFIQDCLISTITLAHSFSIRTSFKKSIDSPKHF